MTQPTDRQTRVESDAPITILPPDSPSQTSAYEAPTRPTRSGCLWGVGGALGCLGFVLLVPTVLIVIGVTSFGGLVSGIGSFLGVGSPLPANANVITTQTIVQGIQPMGQLVSVSSQLAKADVYVGVGQGVLNACGFGANHVVQGAVDAGIDLTQIQETDIAYDEEQDRYMLIIPAPQLTSCRVEYIRQYDRTTTTCNVDWDEARLLANYVALTDFRNDAIEGGILARAEQEARLVLGNFIQLVTGKSVEVVFRPADPDAPVSYPPSCNPETPQGWTFNPSNGHWEK